MATDIYNPYQFSTGIIPLPGTPMYEEMLRRVQGAADQGLPGGSGQNQAEASNLLSRAGINYGIYQPGAPGTDANSLSSSASGSLGGFGGAGSGGPLEQEFLSYLRGAGGKSYDAARNRLNEDYGLASQKEMTSLARRGLFRSGVGQQELMNEVERPYTRGLSDLASNMADYNSEMGLRKAGILGDYLAQMRQAAADRFKQGSSAGTGAQRYDFGSSRMAAMGGGGTSGARFGGGGGGGAVGSGPPDAFGALGGVQPVPGVPGGGGYGDDPSMNWGMQDPNLPPSGNGSWGDQYGTGEYGNTKLRQWGLPFGGAFNKGFAPTVVSPWGGAGGGGAGGVAYG